MFIQKVNFYLIRFQLFTLNLLQNVQHALQVAVPKKKKKRCCGSENLHTHGPVIWSLFPIVCYFQPIKQSTDKVLLLYKKSYTIVLVAAFWCSCAKDKFKYVCLNTLPAELVRGRPKPHTLLYTLCKRVIIVTIWVYTYLPKKKKERWGWGDYRLHGKANTLCNAWKWTCRV